MAESKVKFGIMCGSSSFAAWQANAIKYLFELENVKCELLIKESGKKDSFLKKAWALFHFKNLLWLIYLFIFKKKSKTSHKADLSDLLKDTASITCKTVKEGKFSEYFKKEDIQKIKSYNLDFILRFGFGIIRGEILNTAKYGVWSYHHGDEQKYRGGPPCFWEIYHQNGITGAILQKLTDRLDAGIILKKGYLKTNYSYIKNRDQLYSESSRWPAELCIDIINGQTEKFEQNASETTAPIYHKPTNAQFIIFLARSVSCRFKELVDKLFYIDYWNIGIVKDEIGTFLNSQEPEVEWFPLTTKKKFIADPFALPDPDDLDKLHIFFETYPFDKNKGTIDYCTYKEQFIPEISSILNKEYHLSYPYLLYHDDEIYMVPESYGNNNIAIYKAAKFPYKWKKEATLIENFKGIDSTIINHDGMWWLFTSDKADGAHHNLQLFYSTDLFAGWTPHPKNPVKTDIRSARCAGTPFVSNGSLIRPSMDYSSKIEGRITLNKILTLSKTEFKEISIKTIEPYKESFYSDKIHTLAAAGNYTIIDGCRECLIFSDIRFFKSKIKRLIKSITS